MSFACVAFFMGLWLAVSTGTVAAEPVSLHTRPGGARIFDTVSGRVLATAPVAPDSVYRWQAPITRPCSILIQRPPFDDAPLTLTWDASVHRWQFVLDGRRRLLSEGWRLQLPRTVQLQFDPGDALVYQDLGPAVGDGAVLEVDGGRRAVGALVASTLGYVIPHAINPPLLWVARDGFYPAPLQLTGQQMDSDARIFPDHPLTLKPRYGWLSRPEQRAGMALLLGVLGIVWIVLGPYRKRTRAVRQRRLAVWTEAARSQRGAADALNGQTLTTDNGEQFVLMGILGKGGSAVVYEAASLSLDRPQAEHVAVKFLLRRHDEAGRQRFMREVKVCCAMTHPSVVQLLDWGFLETDSTEGVWIVPYIVMEHVRGVTMTERLAAGPASERAVVGWLVDILKGLRLAHEAGVIHRDIKPQNIMILSNERAKLMDFGIAHLAGCIALTLVGVSLGTPQYMSPEQFEGVPVIPASDLYSLGIVAYEALTGQRPFMMDDINSLTFHVLLERPLDVRTMNPGVGEDLDRVVMRMLRRPLAERFAKADQVLDALGPVIERLQPSG